MPAAYDNEITVLTTLSEALREMYEQDLLNASYRYGSVTGRIFNPSSIKINGDGKNYQVKSRHAYAARVSRDLYAAPVRARAFQVKKWKAQLSEASGGSDNDFSVLYNATETTHLDIKRVQAGGEHALREMATELADEMIGDDGELLNKLRNTPASGVIGTISGGLVGDARSYDDASAYSSGVYGRIQLSDAFPISHLAPGVVINVYDSSTDALNAKAMVTDVNADDQSVGIQKVDADSEPVSSGNFTAGDWAAGDKITLDGAKGNGMKSIAEWMVADGTSGEDFMGIDRTQADNRWMLPTVVGPSSSSPMSHRYLRDLGAALFQTQGERVEDEYVWVMHPRMRDTLLDLVDHNAIAHFAADEARGQRMLEYGFTGSMYSDPYFGRVGFEADPLTPADVVRALRLGDWETLHPLDQLIEVIPGYINGGWYRKDSGQADGTLGMVYRMDRYGIVCDVCRNPHKQGLIRNVTPQSV